MSVRLPRARLLAALVLLAIAALLVLGRGSGEAAVGVAPVDPANGFPAWYEDAPGVRLALCASSTDPYCVLPAAGEEPGFDPAQPSSFPANWPSEAFYALATSDIVTTPGCKGTRPGKAFIRFALEAAFANGAPAAGDQITFGRTRLSVTGGLCPGATYVFHHPYGDLTYQVDSSGALKRKDGTVDVGCGGTPCTFNVALGSEIFGSFLRWDPSISAPPAGTIGDGASLHAVTGGTVRNFFSIEGPAVDKGPNVTVGQTTLFTVAGKLVGPLTATPQTIAFGDQPETTTSAPQTITLENVGSAPITGLSSRTITGANASAFALGASTCADTLASHATCTLAVSFSPAAAGTKSAQVTIAHSGLNSPFTIALGGTGTAGTSVFAATPASIDFGSLATGVTSDPAERITVRNDGGTAPLTISAVALADGTDFRIASETCTAASPLAKDASCTIDVTFAPGSVGAKTDTVRITDGAAVVHAVALLGRGSDGTPAVSPGVDGNNKFASWYEDANGVRLEQCVDGTDPNCVLPGAGEEPGFDPGLRTSFPGNFPTEFFYAVATSDLISTSCNRGGVTTSGKGYMRAAVEGAFAGAAGDVVAGDQMVFGRLRFFADGLCPNTTYTFVHPYGQTVVTTNDLGVAARSPNTEDIGCVAWVPPATCDFSEALASPVFRGFLRWPSGAPEGYLGDGVTPHTVVGAPSGHNFLRIVEGSPIAADSVVVGETNLFSVAGKIAGPVQTSSSIVDFAGQDTGTTSAARLVTVTNLGLDPVALGAITIAGTNAGDFGHGAAPLSGTVCAAGLTLARDESCVISVVFTPTAVGKRSASVSIAHDGLRSPVSVDLLGTGILVGDAPVLTTTPEALTFPDQRVHTFGDPQHVTVGNGGSAPLEITGVSLTRSDRDQFLVSADACTGVVLDPGASCGIDVRFGPGLAGLRSAGLTIDSNAGNTTVDLTGTATGGNAAVSSGRQFGYPMWFGDESRLHVVPCLDSTDGQCVLPAAGDEPGYDPNLPVSLPGNFPTEFFYTIADSDKVATPGCADPAIPAGDAFIRVALEGAFGNAAGDVVPGDQVVFGRVRIVVKGGLCPGVDYTFVHPYGVTTLTADEAGGIKPAAGTLDVGCLGVPCAFTDALSSHIAGNVLRWPAGAPAGYLGDVSVAHAVTGSPLGQNLFRIERADDGTVLGTTDQFFVSGKLAAPAGVPASTDFGTQTAGTTSAPRLVTVTNTSSAPLSLTAIAATGPFAVVVGAPGTCSTAAPLAIDASCDVAVTFTPLTSGVKTGTLDIAHDGGFSSPATVALTGTGIEPAPAASVSAPSLAFGSQRVGTTGAAQVVTITNTGGGNLALAAPAVTGDFTVTGTTCGAPVGAGASCTVSVAFGPTATGARTGTLSLTSNAVGSPHQVTLAGTGIRSAIAVNRTQISFGLVNVGTTATQTMTVTNTGTATLTLSAISTAAPFGLGANACQGVTIAVGGTCQITVTYQPAAAGNSTGSVTIVSDAPTSPTTVALTGSGQVPGGPAPTTITVTPASIDFGSLRVGSRSTKSVNIKNTGTATLTFNPVPAITGSANFTIVANSCGAVAPNGTCRIDIRYAPTGAVGTRSGSLSLSWNGGTTTVTLAGAVR